MHFNSAKNCFVLEYSLDSNAIRSYQNRQSLAPGWRTTLFYSIHICSFLWVRLHSIEWEGDFLALTVGFTITSTQTQVKNIPLWKPPTYILTRPSPAHHWSCLCQLILTTLGKARAKHIRKRSHLFLNVSSVSKLSANAYSSKFHFSFFTPST